MTGRFSAQFIPAFSYIKIHSDILRCSRRTLCPGVGSTVQTLLYLVVERNVAIIYWHGKRKLTDSITLIHNCTNVIDKYIYLHISFWGQSCTWTIERTRYHHGKLSKCRSAFSSLSTMRKTTLSFIDQIFQLSYLTVFWSAIKFPSHKSVVVNLHSRSEILLWKQSTAKVAGYSLQ